MGPKGALTRFARKVSRVECQAAQTMLGFAGDPAPIRSPKCGESGRGSRTRSIRGDAANRGAHTRRMEKPSCIPEPRSILAITIGD